jgi:hypothetical protein
MFVPLAAAAKFKDADISAQSLIDSSVVLVNNNRFDIKLSD